MAQYNSDKINMGDFNLTYFLILNRLNYSPRDNSDFLKLAEAYLRATDFTCHFASYRTFSKSDLTFASVSLLPNILSM